MKNFTTYALDTQGQTKEEENLKSIKSVSEWFCENIFGLLHDSTCASLSDVIVCVDKKEVKAHKAILAGSSNYFRKLFHQTPSVHRIEFHQPWQIVNQLIICIYGGRLNAKLDPEMLLDVLKEARNLEMPIVACWDVTQVITEKLTVINAPILLNHPEMINHKILTQNLCRFIAGHLKEILKYEQARKILKAIDKIQLINIIVEAAAIYNDLSNVEILLKFILGWVGLDSICDLLKESKEWPWNIKAGSSRFKRPVKETDNYIELFSEIAAKKCINGGNFNWWIQVEQETSNKFKVVFDSVTPSEHASGNMCVGRFPASTFYAEFVPNQSNIDIFNPIFVCFPENVAVHWSSTFSLKIDNYEKLSSRGLKLYSVENPLASFIMYYLSCNLPNQMISEDIINRLPHVEYRCLASYFLHNDHIKRSIENINQPIHF